MKRLIAVGLAALLIVIGSAAALAQSDELREGDARDFDTPPDLIVVANVETEEPPSAVEITDSGDITRDDDAVTLTDDGQWIEAAITSDEVTSLGVQFWGDEESGWARVSVDGRTVWRGSTYGEDGDFVRYLEVADLEPGSHTVHVEATGRMGSGGGDEVTVAFFGFSPVSTDEIEPTPAPAPEEEPAGEVLFADDFEDPDSGWMTDDTDAGWMDYDDGAYVIYAVDEATILWSGADQSFDDVDVAVDATLVDGPRNDNVGFGVGCRMNVDDDTGYFFLISGDGYYTILRSDPTEYVTLIEWSETDAVEQGNELNHIAALCEDDQLRFIVNGEEIDSTQDDTYAEGDLALAAITFEDAPGEVHFDNMVVTAPASAREHTSAPRRPRIPVLPTFGEDESDADETGEITETDALTETEVLTETVALTETEVLTETEALTETAPLTETGAITGAPEVETAPDTANILLDEVTAGWEDFDSFRLTIDFGAETEDEVDGTITQTAHIVIASMVEPLAQQVTVVAHGSAEDDSFEASLTQIGETTYTIEPGAECRAETMPEPLLADTDSFGEIFSLFQDFGEVTNAQRVLPNAEIGGLEAEHYVFDASSLPDAAAEVNDLSGEIFLDAESGILLRFVIAGDGLMNTDFMQDVQEGPGPFYFEYELSDIDQPIEITLPDACEGVEVGDTGSDDDLDSGDDGIDDGGSEDAGGIDDSAASPYPLPADATEVIVSEGSTNFFTGLSVNDATDFYLAEMPAAGWSYNEADSMVMGALSLLSFTRAGETVDVTIFGSEDSGSIVVITPAEE